MVGADNDPSLTATSGPLMRAAGAGQLVMMMMMQIVFIGIGAGAATALLFASVASGSIISVLLFYLAPLPILIAVLGWSHWAGIIAATGAAIALAAVFGSVFFFAFLIGVGLPAWWLGYLAMLARPASNGGANALVWYPPGRLVVWAALLGTLVVIAAIPNFGLDEESFRAGLRRGFERLLRVQTGLPANSPLVIPGVTDTNRLIEFFITVIPAAAAVLSTITNTVNLWLAARVVKFSGRLRRPWPEIPAMTFPGSIAALLAAATAGTFVPGLVGVAAMLLCASLLIAFGVLGLAVLHAITKGMDSRGFVLAGVYAAVFIFGWPMLLFSLLGLLEIAFDIRSRLARKRGPPART